MPGRFTISSRARPAGPIHRMHAWLVRQVAREADTRALLRRRFAAPRAKGLKALLAAAPLEGIDLERARDTGRPLDL